MCVFLYVTEYYVRCQSTCKLLINKLFFSKDTSIMKKMKCCCTIMLGLKVCIFGFLAVFVFKIFFFKIQCMQKYHIYGQTGE